MTQTIIADHNQNIDLRIEYLTNCSQHISVLAKLQYDEISQHWVKGASVETTKQRLMTHLNYDQLPITLVALSEQTPVGMASLRINDGIRPDLEPWLGSLVVHPKYRGSRVGERLIKAIEQEALARGYEKLYLLAFDATIPNWYSRLGWKKMGTDELFTHTVTVMQLELEK